MRFKRGRLFLKLNTLNLFPSISWCQETWQRTNWKIKKCV